MESSHCHLTENPWSPGRTGRFGSSGIWGKYQQLANHGFPYSPEPVGLVLIGG